MTYLIKDATLLNIVLSHRDDVNTKDFTPSEYNETVRNLFKDFEPRYAYPSASMTYEVVQLLTEPSTEFGAS